MNTGFSTAKFEVKVDGINPNRLVELAGKKGSFFIGEAGGNPELEEGFFYGDDSYQFCFYVELPKNSKNNNVRDIIIFDATNQRLGRGGKFKVDKKDVSYLEKNIRKLFETRFFFDLRKIEVKPYSEIGFTWSISK